MNLSVKIKKWIRNLRSPILRIVVIFSSNTDEEPVNMIKVHYESIFLLESRLKIIQRYRFSGTNTYMV